MMSRMVARLAAMAAGVMLAGCSVVGGKAAEEPPFTLVSAEDGIEIRDYPALTVARTVVGDTERGPAVRRGFGRLFDYIGGANDDGQDITMTAPVITGTAERGREIAMTAPVVTGAAEGGWETVFVLPESMTPETAPRPTDPTVAIALIPARRVAVARFAGVLDAESIERERARLAAWLAERGMAHEGDWQAAGYNPPWTIPTLRRNEIMVTLKGGTG